MVWGTASRRCEEGRAGALFLLWLGILVVCGLFLLLVPSVELAAVEIVVLSFAVLYGFGSWPVVRTVVSVSAFAVVAAAIMLPRVLRGDLPAVELVEVVTPVVLAAVVTYHVRRRDDAIETAEALAAADRRRARARERLGRMTSHELRTPLTIARGYVDHLAASEPDDARREDLTTVREELDQLTRLADRLVRAVSLDLGAPDVPSDDAELLDDVRRRWAVITDREIVVRAQAGPVPVNPERLRAALDTLVENSVRYTGPGDRICLFSEAFEDRVEIGVEDSGPGMSADLVTTVNRDDVASEDDENDVSAQLRDAYSQTGFGLRIVQGIARSADGHLVAGRGADGGARVALVVPRA
ncbi:sensor histidine kinase KdpD [Phycicoccus sp. DTK01]|uniref:sensor histidine kinase n=1 Tax=Phycicoccus sp. DTK01 TaxID=2785745 RepID=UPI001A90C5E5|nr:HAMP domain-containing sensor histidine kinase [Phycicoccus sp. DTK01]GIL37513.1 hypothetical protein PDTK01_35880 [Phycicoccus sp. DTK01]